MRPNVPYLAEETIERNAAALLAEFAHSRGIVLTPPIPIEDIVEKHLGLSIDFDDLHARFSVPRPENGQTDILGAIYSDGSIFIDETLDPEENPAREGRYRFTVAHEGCGHWELHRHLFLRGTAQASHFDGESRPEFICRSNQSKERVEWQADFYASCVLMPRCMIHRAWEAHFGDSQPRAVSLPRQEDLSQYSDPVMRQTLVEWRAESVDARLREFSVPFAFDFGVSATAMRIRLEKLGLLRRTVPPQLHLLGN